MDLKDVLAAKGPRVVTVSAKSSITDAIRTMHAEKVGAVMVPDAEGCPVGIFTERDVVRLYADGERDFDKLPVEARMTCSVVLGRLSKPGQWGIPYQKDLEIGRTPMKVGKTKAHVENVTISIDDQPGNTANLRIEWGTTSVSAPFTIG